MVSAWWENPRNEEEKEGAIGKLTLQKEEIFLKWSTPWSPESVEPGNFDPATRTACWHYAECAHEWRHRWCWYGQIPQEMDWTALPIFITNDSLHTIIILVDSIHKFSRIHIPAATQHASIYSPLNSPVTSLMYGWTRTVPMFLPNLMSAPALNTSSSWTICMHLLVVLWK